MEQHKESIGVFDSGYGGLTILKEIVRKLPEYNYVYLGDNARAPYGARSFEVVYEYTREAVHKLFEMGCRLVQNGHGGILATRGTVASGSYPIEVGKLYGEERFRITQLACPMWVPLVENNELDGEGAIYFVRKYIQELLGTDPEIDTIILGCTHYPLLRPLIARFVPSRVKIIGQGQIVAGSLADYLKRHPEIDRRLGKDSRRSYLTTEKTELFDRMAGLFLKEEISSQRIFMC